MLGTVDFSGVQDGYTIIEAGKYSGETKDWEPKPNKNGDGQHIQARFVLVLPDGKHHTLFKRWFLTPKALWVIKRDLIDMGVSPTEFEGEGVNLENILNRVFGSTPTPVTVTVLKTQYDTTDEAGEPVKRDQNVVDRISLRTA